MLQISEYINQDTVQFLNALREKFSAGNADALGAHSRLLDHVTPLPSSSLIYEFECACQSEANRKQWLDACIADGIIALFDETGELKPSIRQRFMELARVEKDSLDAWIYNGLPKDQVHMQWLSAYCLSLLDRAYRALPDEFLTCPEEMDPMDFLPVSANSWINATLKNDYAARPELFRTMVKDAYQKRHQQQDAELIDYWKRAQQCALEVACGEPSQIAFLKVVMQLQSRLLLNLPERIGDTFGQDEVAEEYDRISDLVGQSQIEVMDDQVTLISQLWQGVSSLSAMYRLSDEMIEKYGLLEAAFEASPHDFSSELYQLESGIVNFSSIALKRVGVEGEGAIGSVIDCSETGQLMSPVIHVLTQRAQSQDLAAWHVGRAPLTGKWLYHFWCCVLPVTHSYQIQIKAHELSAMQPSNEEDAKAFHVNRLNAMKDLSYLCQSWLSRHETLTDWQQFYGTQDRLISIMSLQQTLGTQITDEMQKIDRIQDQEHRERCEARRALVPPVVPDVLPQRSGSLFKNASSFGMVFAGFFLLSYLARFMPHPHVGHMAGLMMQMGFSGVAGLAYTKGSLPLVSFWRHHIAGSADDEVAASNARNDVTSSRNNVDDDPTSNVELVSPSARPD